MEERIPLVADKGYIYTNGKGSDGVMLWVAIGVNPDKYYQIRLDEYEALKESYSIEATEEDYQNALKGFGVQL